MLTGELHMARNGAGYLLRPDTDAAVWIEAKDLSTALPGDMVTVQLGRDGTEGRIARIEKRAPRAIVGTVTAGAPFARVQPLSPTFRQEFLVPDTRGAAVGDRVVMRLARWENPRLAPEGIVTDIIGPADIIKSCRQNICHRRRAHASAKVALYHATICMRHHAIQTRLCKPLANNDFDISIT